MCVRMCANGPSTAFSYLPKYIFKTASKLRDPFDSHVFGLTSHALTAGEGNDSSNALATMCRAVYTTHAHPHAHG